MLIIGVDPGTTMSAYVVMDTDDYSIVDKGKIHNDDLLRFIREDNFGVLAIEVMQSFGMGVGKEVFETAYFIGALMQVASDNRCKVHRVYRTDVKMHHCHTTRAKDANIRQALIDRFGKPGTKKNQGETYGISADMWSALGIAVFWIDTHKQQDCNKPVTREG